jgi:hypothetical protein
MSGACQLGRAVEAAVRRALRAALHAKRRQSAVGSRQSAVGSRQSAVGSRQDVVGCELSALSSRCPDRRISDKQNLTQEVRSSEKRRAKKRTKADRHFTTADASIELKRLNPATCTTRGLDP